MSPARPARLPGIAALAVQLLFASGCATPGPNHVYTLNSAAPATILDTGPGASVEVPAFTAAEEQPSGLAYDPYTDHLFLRLAPGNRIRVVDRPDRSIKREFTVPELASAGGGDLAVRPRDGHLFFTCTDTPHVVETDRFGKFVRRLDLAGLTAPPEAIAYDAARNRLLVVTGGTPATLSIHDLQGRQLQAAPLAFPTVTSLAYDPVARELHAMVPGVSTVMVLDENGRLLRRGPDATTAHFLDLGQRSFVRVF